MLAKFLPDIHTITLRWRRGSAYYKPIPLKGSSFVLADSIDWQDAPDKKAKEDRRAWTGEHAQKILDGDLWPLCLRMARAEGPVIDVQLSIYGYNEKTGALDLLCDAHGTRINLDPNTPHPSIDDPYDQRTDAMVQFIQHQTEAIKTRDESNKQLMTQSIELIKAAGTLTGGAFDVAKEAMEMKNSVAGAHADEVRERREYELRKLTIQARHESFKEALGRIPFDDLGMYLRARAAGMSADEIPTDCRHAARLLLDSLSDDQLAQLDPELAADIRTVLSRAANEENEETAQLVLMALLPKLLQSRDAIANVITPQQAALLEFIRDQLARMQ